MTLIAEFSVFFGPIAMSALLPRRLLLLWCFALSVALAINAFHAYDLWQARDDAEGGVIREANLWNHNSSILHLWLAAIIVFLRFVLRQMVSLIRELIGAVRR